MRPSQTRLPIVIALSAAVLVLPRAEAIPIHPHGDTWTTWERDGDRGGDVTVVHGHPSPGGHEAGDESHQHYDAEPIRGPQPAGGLQPWGAYGAWDNRRAFVDEDVPFTDQAEYAANRVAHGYIQEKSSTMPRYTFDGNVPDFAKGRVTDAFDLWGGIEAQVSPVSGLKLDTGIGFLREDDNDKPHEMRVHWTDQSMDFAGGGFVEGLPEGVYGTANVVDVFFDSSLTWDETVLGVDLTKWHFFSVALHEIGHMLFLEHSPTRDTDLMQPTVGAPLDAGLGSLSYRWTGYAEAANEVDDRFLGTKYERVAMTEANPSGIESTLISDRDSVRAIKSLYSITVPEPATLALLATGLALLARNRDRVARHA